MSSFLFEILIDPVTKEPLIHDINKNVLTGSFSNVEYPIIQNVPRILVSEKPDTGEAKIHNDSGTKFEYATHYQIDSQIFDYSGTKMGSVSKNELRRLRESIISAIPKNSNIILDIGCGGGWVSKMLVPLGKKVISSDISENNPINALKDVQHINHAGLIADAYHLPVMDGSIDCIIAAEVMEHVPDPRVFIEKLVRLLKPEGILIISTPYNEKIEYQLCVHCNRQTPKNAHLHSFNEMNISDYLPANGIKFEYKTLINSHLLKFRIHLALKFLPYRLWRFIDALANKLRNRPVRLEIFITKLTQPG